MITLPVLLIGLAALLLLALVVAIWWQHRRRSRAVPAGPRTVADLVAQRAGAAPPTPAAAEPPAEPAGVDVPAAPEPPTDDADVGPAAVAVADPAADAPPADASAAAPPAAAPPAAAPPADAEPADAEPVVKPPPVATDPATPWVRAALMNGIDGPATAVADPDPPPALGPDEPTTDLAARTLPDEPPTDEVPTGGPAQHGADEPTAEIPAADPATAEIPAGRSVPREPAPAEPVPTEVERPGTAAEAPSTTEAGATAAPEEPVTAEIAAAGANADDEPPAGGAATGLPDAPARPVGVDGPRVRPADAPAAPADGGAPGGPTAVALPLAAAVGAGVTTAWAAAPPPPAPVSGRRGLRLVADPTDEDAADEPRERHVRSTGSGESAVRAGPESRTAEQAAADLALLRTFGPGDLDTRPGRAPVVALEGAARTERPRASGAAQDVRVRAVGRDGAAAEGAELALLDDRGRESSATRSGGDGRGRLRAPHPGSYLLVATAPGHQPGAAALTVGDAPVDVEVLLVRSAVLSGQVLGEDGPVDGARVTLVQDGEIVGEADADPDGRYRIPDLAGGEYALAVSAAGCDRVAALVHLTDGAELAHDVELEPAVVPAG